MDIFKNMCKEQLNDRGYFSLAAGQQHEHQVIAITQIHTGDNAGPEVTVHETTIGTDGLVEFVNCGTPRDDISERPESTQTRLVIIGIKNSAQGGLAMRRDVFEGLLESRVGIDYSAVWLLLHHYDGYHFFTGNNEESMRETHFFGWGVFAVVWAYDYKTCSTLALFIDRLYRKPGETSRLSGLLPIIVQHKAFISSPIYLGYVLSLAIGAGLDVYQEDWRQMREIEVAIGYGYGQTPRRIPGNIDQFTTRALRAVGLMLEQVKQTQKDSHMVQFGHSDISWRQRSFDSSTTLAQAVPLMTSRIRAYDEYMDYVIVRAERLSAVLFALLTHRDAETSVQQAEASHEIAKAAKRDSSDMKTIAIMTMAFLPATFLAALFAIPSLDWQSDDVIQSNHWVYWAFTIPATILVFFLWYLLNQRDFLRCLKSHKDNMDGRS
ncbi:hypothetical protein PFICI_09493 [Pestalotiopsis fici W106-1]|uniref:Uncharacterized protein n=1 Tax=Pestalotiopsis fici (strain W106-1 / CGMCC3.15140) TaxID=1229662 RepID=W3X0L6_PESFW|nr:uncharacterized protein PFICI_09493 [Pestalotiopsis fici W106-1]ETS79640.1 hypothetical protein PFICI_09493 [Pestalotiopsis fici W106-1]